MKVQPYSTVGELAFGISREAVIGLIGAPLSTSSDRHSRTELRYPRLFVRLVAGSVVEVTADSEVVELGDISVPFERLAEFLRQNDASTFETVGFVVSPAYGVAFDPAFRAWVTAFAKDELPKWRKHAA